MGGTVLRSTSRMAVAVAVAGVLVGAVLVLLVVLVVLLVGDAFVVLVVVLLNFCAMQCRQNTCSRKGTVSKLLVLGLVLLLVI